MRVLRFVEPIKTTNSKTFLATLASLISRLNDRVTTFQQSRFFLPPLQDMSKSKLYSANWNRNHIH